jgi:hypothetical protein
MTDTASPEAREAVLRPIIGLWNRTPGEVYDIMCARFEAHLRSTSPATGEAGEMLDDAGGLRELRLLYNHTEDDSRQFTRWQMVTAINHGIRLSASDTEAMRLLREAREQLKELLGPYWRTHPALNLIARIDALAKGGAA